MDKKNILIVDDEPDILQVLSCGLAALGLSVTSINNGRDAIKLAIEKQPDLIILDVLMPGMDGGEVARELKNHPETKDIPVLFLTGMFPKREKKEQFHMANGNIMMNKPYEIGELFVAMQELLGEKAGV